MGKVRRMGLLIIDLRRKITEKKTEKERLNYTLGDCTRRIGRREGDDDEEARQAEGRCPYLPLMGMGRCIGCLKARNYEPNDTKIGSIRAQMSPDQGVKALLEGSNHNSDYQTVSKFDNLIVESSGSTRRIQRAQERRNPTSLSQKIVHRTIHDQGIQYRPSVPNHSLFPRIYGPCHSRKSINRAPFLLEKGHRRARARRDQGRDRRPLLPPCSSSTTAGVRRTTA
ncbi:hypothetical protein M5K25_023787 [Dendrobium thyrsiflorum]|uniref:Uncharacterized protein n=1 Tax=Dendrobium thyrsiflorum TaxID=117978 RepID=A0ABD0U0F0_DENTH